MRVRSIRNLTKGEVKHAADAPTESTASSPRAALTEVEAARYIGMSTAWLKKSRTQRFRNIVDAQPFVRAGAMQVVYHVDDLDVWQERYLERVGPAPWNLGWANGRNTPTSSWSLPSAVRGGKMKGGFY